MDAFLTWNPRMYKKDEYIRRASIAIKKAGLNLIESRGLDEKCTFDKGLVIVLGGDGSVFRTIHRFVGNDVMLMPVNVGGVGFLSDYGIDDIEKALTRVQKKEYSIESLPLYKSYCGYFVNDLVVSAAHSTGVVNFEISVENFGNFKVSGDGIIISSRIGSSAYNLSSNGPLLLDDGLIITPIAPFSFSAPIVVGSRKISVVTDEKNPASIVYDGVLGEFKREFSVESTQYASRIIRFSNPLERIRRLWKIKSDLL